MMNKEQTSQTVNRLSRIEGQIRGIRKMIEDGRYCIDILTQTRAISAAINKVEALIMKQHLETCVADSLAGSNKDDKESKIDEIMEVFSRFNK